MNAITDIIAQREDTADADLHRETLMAQGYCVVPDAMDAGMVEALATDFDPVFEHTPRSVGAFYGGNTKRFHSLLSRSPHMAAFVLQPTILDIVRGVLGAHCDLVQLNLTQAIELLPGGLAQPPHRDQDMWPIHSPGVEYLVNVMWPLTPFTADNGATVIWPNSHRRQHEIIIGDEEAVSVELDPGAALLFLGSTLHGGGVNRTDLPRRGMIVSYSLGWLKPYELPWLAYPPQVARTFPAELADLIGYRAHRPNLGTFEGQCPSALLLGEPALGAVDALRPEQEQLISLYRAGGIPPGTTLAELLG
jgi:ectoine hydroxylase-related dioxygenase (phytanoyl-CoA dioxygenase family)